METQPQNQSSDDGASLDHNNYLPELSDTNGDGESEHKLSAEEVKGALEITASTGKFWQDWEDLKSMLYFQLKQVLSEYPEATMDDDQQNSALGETYLHLVKRLEEALFSFIEGPPFTLQRLSEILLSARTIYPKLSKLALALEKNLLVTSTLTKSTDPYPPSIVQREEDTKAQAPSLPEPERQQPEPEAEQSEPETEQSEPKQPDSVENGRELTTGDRDEIMTEADGEAEEDDQLAIDMETYEQILSGAHIIPEPASDF